MSRVVGIDLSLTSTGVALIDPMFGPPICSTKISKGRADATLLERAERLHRLQNQISTTCTHADLVVIEGPSFGQARQGGQHDRAGLWWLVVDALRVAGVPVVEAPPACRMKYATGKGNAKKDAVLAAVIRRYPNVLVGGNDEADALVLAAMGARHLGEPIDDLPLVNLTAMDKIRWPELVSDS